MHQTQQRGKPRLAIVASAVIAAGATVLAGCAAPQDGGAGTTLRIAQAGADAINFSPSPAYQDPELGLMAEALFDSLFGSADGGVNISPGLATEWSLDDERTTLSVTIRDGVTFSDGSDLDAQDVVDTLNWNFDQPELFPGFEKIDNVEATGDQSFELHQTAPDALLLVNLRRIPITSSEAIADPDTMISTPIGTGAYVLNAENTVEASSYVLDKRDDAWNADQYPFEQLEFNLVGTDPSAAVNALRAGQVDFIPRTDGSTAESLTADGYEAIPYYWVYFAIWFDTTGTIAPPLADVRVRQAISYALDRQGIADSVNFGYGNPSAQMEANPDGALYRPGRDEDYAYDVDKAKELLAEAGYPDGFEMTMVSASGLEAYAPVIQQSFADIGITLDFKAVTPDETIPEFTSGKYAAIVTGATAGEVTVSTGAGFPYSNPWPGNNTPELEALIATLNAGTDEEVLQASAEMGDYLLDNARAVFFAHPGFVQIADPAVVAFTDYKTWLGQIPLRAMIPAE